MPLRDLLSRFETLVTGSSVPDSVDTHELLAHITQVLGAQGNGNIALAQINPTPGDLEGNAHQILRYMRMSEAMGLDLVIFPELALMGYPPRDVIGRHPFLVAENQRWLTAIAEQSGKTYAAIGFVEARSEATGRPYYNAAAIVGEGRVQKIVRKVLLPEYGEFEDQRQFESAPPADNTFTIYGRRYGFTICEDIWNDADFFERPLYTRNPIEELLAYSPEILVNLSSSPTRSRKEQMKHNLCSHLSSKTKLPLLYANQVGSVDEVGFDGASRAYDASGQLIARAMMFDLQLLVVNPFKRQSQSSDVWIEPLPAGLEKTLTSTTTESKSFDADDDSDLARTYQLLCQGIRDYFAKTDFKRATLGLSGGLDSSVSVVLLADALGAKNVLGVSMPSTITPDENRSDAAAIAEKLGIQFTEVPIGRVTKQFADELSPIRPQLETVWGEVDARSNAADNIQAISRATILRQLGNEFRALPIATCDKSELYLGYATVNGDMSGGLTPLGDVPKTKVRALARWLNENRRAADGSALLPVLPSSVITKPSGADLKRDPVTGKLVTAEDELMPYAFADEIIWRLETLKQSQQEMLNAPFQYETRFGVTKEQKAEWLSAFFTRMSRAVFKWFIVPPILIVEGNGSIAKSDYHHPIVASRIRWQGHTDAEIVAICKS